MAETLAAAGGLPQHFRYLIHHYVLGSPLTHLLVTAPFALAGAWLCHYWGLILGILCAVLTVRALREGNKGLLIWFSICQALRAAALSLATDGND
jgi:hypothetical protein